MERISIVITNFNGRKHLEHNLPSLIKALNFSGGRHEILVVDDGSTDGSVQFLREHFPRVRVISLEKNQGYINACNLGFSEAKSRLVYLMNNDVEVSSDFLSPLIAHFQNEDTFAVDSGEINYDSEGNEYDRIISVDFRWGIVWYKYHLISPRNKAYPTLFIHGGHTLFDKEKFLTLGSLDSLFSPIYWDCWDLSFRAWRCGWKSFHEPASKVYHRHKTTINKLYSNRKISTIHWEHCFLFTWKNISSRWFLLKHIFFLPIEIIVLPFIGKGFFSKAFFQALKRLKEALQSRKRVRSLKYVFTDKEIIKRFSFSNLKKYL